MYINHSFSVVAPFLQLKRNWYTDTLGTLGTQEPSKNGHVKLKICICIRALDSFLSIPLSRSIHRHPSAAQDYQLIPSIQPNLGLPCIRLLLHIIDTSLVLVHFYKRPTSQYSLIHTTGQLPLYSGFSTHLLIPNSIRDNSSKLLKHFISRTWLSFSHQYTIVLYHRMYLTADLTMWDPE